MPHKITLKNNISFFGDSNKTIFNSANQNGIILEHSCLTARCSSCKARVLSGEYESLTKDIVLSDEERRKGYLLTCNTLPKSDILLDIENLGSYDLTPSKTFPCKIDSIENLNKDVIKLVLRLPPTTNFKFLAGQYVNLIKGSINRSYSIANTQNANLEFFIKNYEDGIMSHYWFNSAKVDDVLRLQGPLGTFFLRDNLDKNIVFMATGTGIAPIQSILKDLNNKDFHESKVTVIWGGRYEESLFLDSLPFENLDFHKVVSRPTDKWKGHKGYVQEVLVSLKKNLSECVVYACGSNEMIQSSKKLLTENGLSESDFYSDAFVSSN